MWRPVLHIVLHFVVPGIAARLLFPAKWKTAWLVMLAALLIDMDHLLADPIYSADRCSIGFHPLHTYPAVGLYAAFALIPQTRLAGIGLAIHIGLDALDCLLMRIVA